MQPRVQLLGTSKIVFQALGEILFLKRNQALIGLHAGFFIRYQRERKLPLAQPSAYVVIAAITAALGKAGVIGQVHDATHVRVIAALSK